MFNQTTTRKQNLRNPQLHIGKYVRHYANWMDYQYPLTLNDNATDDYFVCEYTGKLTQICNHAYYGDYFESIEEAWAAGYSEHYFYSHEGMMKMVAGAKALAA